MHDELISTSEAAELLGLHRLTVVEYIHAGTLPAYRVGKRNFKISRAELDAWLERSRVSV